MDHVSRIQDDALWMINIAVAISRRRKYRSGTFSRRYGSRPEVQSGMGTIEDAATLEECHKPELGLASTPTILFDLRNELLARTEAHFKRRTVGPGQKVARVTVRYQKQTSSRPNDRDLSAKTKQLYSKGTVSAYQPRSGYSNCPASLSIRRNTEMEPEREPMRSRMTERAG
jgi:hypothetical protein